MVAYFAIAAFFLARANIGFHCDFQRTAYFYTCQSLVLLTTARWSPHQMNSNSLIIITSLLL
jgi:hypothetical protein